MLHLPVLRAGVPYRSLNRNVLKDVRTGEPVAEVSQANRGLISRDLLGMAERRAQLREMPIETLIERCAEAARLFVEEALPVEPEGRRCNRRTTSCAVSRRRPVCRRASVAPTWRRTAS